MAFGGLPRSTRLFYRWLYRRADCVVCQTDAMAADIVGVARILKARVAVLPNPVDVDGIRARVKDVCDGRPVPTRASSGPHLLAVGRLSREKGFDLLLQVFVVVRRRFPTTHLTIAGAGPERSALESQCRALGLEIAVTFAGHVEDLSAHFARASIFVLSSRHEGLPNALLEASAAGLPIVALPCSEGLTDLLRGRPGVWLAPQISAQALSQSLLAALDALHPGERFVHEFVEGFRLDRAIQAYESLIDAVLHGVRR
jgi:glycosyltransferase involved in cell wall biosynthesis